IPDGMVEIGEEAFSSCESLTTIEIPASVTKIWYSAFLCCPDLTIYAPEGSEAEKYAKDYGIPFKKL
ncbi:MAG: leucine-rich repeat protein, partial [Thermoguttaceae bacterium]|nr:leucine-rich repeat protein [Thermoguttaceae bacterium]